MGNFSGLQTTAVLGGGVLFVGLILQAFSSWMEPVLFHLWGGTPSKVILAKKNNYASDARRAHWAKTFVGYFNLAPLSEGESFVDMERSHTIVRRCQAMCLNRGKGRSEEFNAKYAMTRSMLACCVFIDLLWISYSILQYRTIVLVPAPRSCAFFVSIFVISLLGTVVFLGLLAFLWVVLAIFQGSRMKEVRTLSMR